MRRKVILSQQVYEQIGKYVSEVNNRYEVGGILLGYRKKGKYYVVASTGIDNVPNSSQETFVLDGEIHTKQSIELAHQFYQKPSVVGVWHSHILDIDRFSAQDVLSNQQLATLLDGALSMIVIYSKDLAISKCTTYYIDRYNTESCCSTIIDIHNKIIPKKYRKQTRRCIL